MKTGEYLKYEHVAAELRRLVREVDPRGLTSADRKLLSLAAQYLIEARNQLLSPRP